MVVSILQPAIVMVAERVEKETAFFALDAAKFCLGEELSNKNLNVIKMYADYNLPKTIEG